MLTIVRLATTMPVDLKTLLQGSTYLVIRGSDPDPNSYLVLPDL
jgi:hypothetical protein